MNAKDLWIQTYSGKKFYPLAPDPDQIDIRDIAHALSMICRFGGHCREFYSVAQHSVLVSDHCQSIEGKRWGLLHDAAEAYIGDMVSCLKTAMPEFRVVEDGLCNAICKKYEIAPFDSAEVYNECRVADDRMLWTEKRDLIIDGIVPLVWNRPAEPYPMRVVAVSPSKAEALFLMTFNPLFPRWSV